MDEKEIKILLDNYKAGTATKEEMALLESWYLKYQEPVPYELSIKDRLEAVDKVWANLETDNRQSGNLKLWSSKIIGTAALILIMLSIGLYFSIGYKGNFFKNSNISNNKNDIAPGGNTAVLTLANGKTLNLSSRKTGVVIDAAKLTYSDGSEVRVSSKTEYLGSRKGEQSIRGLYGDPLTSANLTVSTPRGGTYQVILPDSTHVWLNAATSLKFPAKFATNERKVELNGEAYFVVKHNSKQPFRVQTAGQVVEDIGTTFNINSYVDEPITRTTLLEGSIRIGGFVLKPGEQAVLFEKQLKISQANINEVVGWKNGYFVFENEQITSIMRKVSRWYNVEVVYKGDKPDDYFIGWVSRFGNVSELLHKLEITNRVHFKIEGRKITVTK